MDQDFSTLLGKTIIEMTGLEVGSENVTFKCSDGTKYVMYHSQDCCESVSIDDITGDMNDLLNTPITLASEESTEGMEAQSEWDESFTWTFYKLATVKGYVDIKWYGTSNGYYSESVYFEQSL